jgi:hypothetical protein
MTTATEYAISTQQAAARAWTELGTARIAFLEGRGDALLVASLEANYAAAREAELAALERV